MTKKQLISFCKWAIEELEKYHSYEILICHLFTYWSSKNRVRYRYLMDRNDVPELTTAIKKAIKRTKGNACIDYENVKGGRIKLLKRVIKKVNERKD